MNAASLLPICWSVVLLGCNRMPWETAHRQKLHERLLVEQMVHQQKERMRLERSERSYDLTHNVGEMCPTHSAKMQVREAPLVYGDLAPRKPEPSLAIFEAEFPFSRERWPGGCVVINGIQDNVRFYVCDSCVAARNDWDLAHPAK